MVRIADRPEDVRCVSHGGLRHCSRQGTTVSPAAASHPGHQCAGRAAVTCASSQQHREGRTGGLCEADTSEGIPKVDKTRKLFQAEGIACGKAGLSGSTRSTPCALVSCILLAT